MFKRLIIAPIHHLYSDQTDPLPKQTELDGGFVIKKFDKNVLKEVFTFFGETYSKLDKEELNRCQNAIYYKYISENDLTEIPDEISNNINKIVQTLRIIKQSRSMVTQIHFDISKKKMEAIRIVHKPSQSIHFPNTNIGTSQHFNRLDFIKLKKYWKTLKSLYDSYRGRYHRVLNALIFFEMGHMSYLYKQRLITFVTCFESLFNISDEQIGITIRLRCSKFLEKDKLKVHGIYKDLKEMYTLRSYLVHGQKTPKKILKDIGKEKRIIFQAEELSRRCLKKILDNDLTDIFDKDTVLNEEFEKLELGLPNKFWIIRIK